MYVCEKFLCHRSKYYFEVIDDPSVLRRGDHIGWYRPLAYWHHAIVIRQYIDHITVVGYTVNNKDDNPCGRVTEQHYQHRSMSSLLRGSLYRITRDDSYTNEYAALRAERAVGQQKYDLFEQNCEHIAIWCKTGLHRSDNLHRCFTSFGKVALAVFLRAVVLAVLLLLQICDLSHDNTAPAADQLTLERSVDIAYFALIAVGFTAYSVYHDFAKIKPLVELSGRELHDDCVESCRRNCTGQVFGCCCHRYPSCRRALCCTCFVACFCCSLCEGTCSLCAGRLRMCSVPCCGRPVVPVIRLVVRSLVRELIAASGPLSVVWFTDDIVSYFAGQHVIVSGNEVVNRAAIILLAIVVASLVSYPVGILVSRCVVAACEPCCCPCIRPSKQAHQIKRGESANQLCPVHDQVVSIPAPVVDYHVTSVPVG